jgi:hypothetical protein
MPGLGKLKLRTGGVILGEAGLTKTGTGAAGRMSLDPPRIVERVKNSELKTPPPKRG